MSKVTMKAGKSGSVVFQHRRQTLFEINPAGEVTMHVPCRLRNVTDAQMAAIRNPREGMILYSTENNSPYLYTAGVWKAILTE